jgi:hypothetical protein
MDNRQSRDQLQLELQRRGLPRAYIDRLLAELDDHFTDILEERNSTMNTARKLHFEPDDIQRRLGTPTQLAIFAVEQYRARNFWGRHPWITYLVAPLPLLAIVLIAFCLAVWLATTAGSYVAVNWFGWSLNPGEHLWLQSFSLALFSWGLIVVPPLITAWLLCSVYQRNALDWRWPVLGCTLLAMVVALFAVSWQLSIGPGAADRGRLTIGFTFSGSADWLLLSFLPKFTLALSIGLLLVKRAHYQLDEKCCSRASLP